MTPWSWIDPDRTAKGWVVTPIVLSTNHVDHVRAYFARPDARPVGPYTVRPRESFRLDAGGMVSTKQHEFERDFFGLKLSVYAIHAEHVLEHAVRPAERRGHGLKYVPSWLVGLALDDTQYDELVRWLEGLLPDARAIADAENAEFNDRFVGVPHVIVAPRPTRGVKA